MENKVYSEYYHVSDSPDGGRITPPSPPDPSPIEPYPMNYTTLNFRGCNNDGIDLEIANVLQREMHLQEQIAKKEAAIALMMMSVAGRPGKTLNAEIEAQRKEIAQHAKEIQSLTAEIERLWRIVLLGQDDGGTQEETTSTTT